MRSTLTLVFLLAASAALAQSDTVAVPIAAWAEAARDTILAIAIAIATFAMRSLPGHAIIFFKVFQVEQLIKRAVDFGINAVKGADEDGVINVKVGNEVVARALQYVVDHGPVRLIEWMGGLDKVKEKIIARIPSGKDVVIAPKDDES